MATKTTKVLPPRPSALGIGAHPSEDGETTEAEVEALADHVIDGDTAIDALTTERDEALLQLDIERKQSASNIAVITNDRDACVKRIAELEAAFGEQTEAFHKQWDAREAAHTTALELAQSGIGSARDSGAAGLVSLPPQQRPAGAPCKLADAPAGKTYALHRLSAGAVQYAPGDEVPRGIVWDGVLIPGIHFELRDE